MFDRMRKKSSREIAPIALSDGIYLSNDFLSDNFCMQQEKRWSDFFVRTFFLFAIVTGDRKSVV